MSFRKSLRPVIIVITLLAFLLPTLMGTNGASAKQVDTGKLNVSHVTTASVVTTMPEKEPEATPDDPPTPVTITVPPPSTYEVPTDEEILAYCEDFRDNGLEELAAHGVPEGAFFVGSCEDGGWGYVFAGKAGGAWEPNIQFGPITYTNSRFLFTFKPDGDIVPDNLSHPVYKDALTVNDMIPGTKVCRMYGDVPVGSFTVVALRMTLWESGHVYAGWQDSKNTLLDWSLEDDGVLPYMEDGTWSIARLIAGHCQKFWNWKALVI